MKHKFIKRADFDAPVVGIIRRGQVFEISKATFGPFYKIKLPPSSIGFVSDIDVKPVGSKNKTTPRRLAQSSQGEVKIKPEKIKIRKSIENTRFRGLGTEIAQYTEDTMGKVRSEGLLFYGIKISGNNTFISGDIYLDTSLMLHLGAPSYYSKITGQSASGWIVFGQMIFETPLSSSRDQMIYAGFGPVIKYSHFDVSIKNGQSEFLDNYLMDDISAGLVLNLGLALRLLDKLAIRAEGKYYFEQSRYSAINFGLQWEY